jgi:hypothetical protein
VCEAEDDILAYSEFNDKGIGYIVPNIDEDKPRWKVLLDKLDVFEKPRVVPRVETVVNAEGKGTYHLVL